MHTALNFTSLFSNLSENDEENEEEEDSDDDLPEINDEDTIDTQSERGESPEALGNYIPLSDGPVMSSPVKGTREERKQKLKEKASKKRTATIRKKQEELSRITANKFEQDVEDALNFLAQRKIHFGEFLKFIFDPSKGQGKVRWHEFFARRGDASQILDWWSSSANSQTGKEEVESWAVGHVAKMVAKEARVVTDSKILQTKDKSIDQEFVTSFSFTSMHKALENLAPIGMRMIRSFSTSQRAEKTHKERRKERTKTV